MASPPSLSLARAFTLFTDNMTADPLHVGTAEIFVMGRRQNFQRWAQNVAGWSEGFEGAGELVRVEDVHFIEPAERIKPMRTRNANPLLEVVLHRSDDYVLEGFRGYLRELGVNLDLDQRISVRDLCFLPVRVPLGQHEAMARFSFLRVAREMPELRQLRPIAWPGGLRSATPFGLEMPDVAPLNPELRVSLASRTSRNVRMVPALRGPGIMKASLIQRLAGSC